MNFNFYIDEVFHLRNLIIKPKIRHFYDDKNKINLVHTAFINRFVKRVISAIIGGLYKDIKDIIRNHIENETNDDAIKSLDNLLGKIGDEPDVSGIRLKQEQKDL